MTANFRFLCIFFCRVYNLFHYPRYFLPVSWHLYVTEWEECVSKKTFYFYIAFVHELKKEKKERKKDKNSRDDIIKRVTDVFY